MSFVLCVIYGLIQPASHMREFLEMALPAFEWLTLRGFFFGLVQSFLYGVYGGLVYSLIYNGLFRRWAIPRERA